MPASKKQRELDLSDFPSGSVTEYTTLVCLACIFDIFTKQLGLAARTAFSEIKRHTPTIEELTSRRAMRPYFDSDEKNPHCPYCGSAKRWLARFDTYCVEGGKSTDVPRRALVKKLPKAGDQFVVIEKKSDSRAVFFEWLDTLGRSLDLEDESWLVEATRMYLERREPLQPLDRRLGARWRPSVSGAESLQRSAADSIPRQPLARSRRIDARRPFDPDGSNSQAALLRLLRSCWDHRTRTRRSL